jgi:hypothetical protein
VWLLGKMVHANDIHAFVAMITTDWVFEIDVVIDIAPRAAD